MVEIAQNLFSTRRGSLVIGGAAALLAGVVLLVYLHSYRNSVKTASAVGPAKAESRRLARFSASARRCRG